MSIYSLVFQNKLTLAEKAKVLIEIIYTDAERKELIRQYDKHDMSFEYAAVDSKDYSGSNEVIYGYGLANGYAFAFAKVDESGKKLRVVFQDIIPEEFIDMAAVHEYEELESHSHEKASLLEMEIAKKDGKFEKYMNWLKENWTDKYDYNMDLLDS